jgi:uncharacterized protein DUF2154
MYPRILMAALILSVATLACGASISLPKLPTPGPTITEQISVPVPQTGTTRLTLSFGAGELNISPGATQLVQGTAEYNVASFKPRVVTAGGFVEIKQGDLLTLPISGDIKNKWDLKLGSSPMDLTINAGAYTGTYRLGGLSLSSLTVKDGASTVDLSFESSNPSDMTLLRYETGASTVSLTGLANANFSTMTFGGGAGEYTLDFSGSLKRPGTVTISTGLSNVILVIPDGTSANVTVESGVSNVSSGAGWSQSGNVYTHAGSGPTLTFVVKTGAGNLTLTR